MTKSNKRRKHLDKFKAKVTLDARGGVKTLAQLATEYKVHPKQFVTWRRQLLEKTEGIVSIGKKAKIQDEVSAPLFEEIDRLEMDIKWLEKSCKPAA